MVFANPTEFVDPASHKPASPAPASPIWERLTGLMRERSAKRQPPPLHPIPMTDQPRLAVEYLDPALPRLKYAKALDAGIDLAMYGWRHENEGDWHDGQDLTLIPGDSVVIRCGVKCLLPLDYYGRLSIRSGLGLRFLTAHVGVVDTGYEGEIMTTLINHGRETVTVPPLGRIVQMVLEKFRQAAIDEVPSIAAISRNERGEAGFGSTGLQ